VTFPRFTSIKIRGKRLGEKNTPKNSPAAGKKETYRGRMGVSRGWRNGFGKAKNGENFQGRKPKISGGGRSSKHSREEPVRLGAGSTPKKRICLRMVVTR